MFRNSKFVGLIITALILPSVAVALPANAAVLYAPTLVLPASDQVLTNYPRTATFKWSAVSGASTYQLEIACDFCISKTNLWANAKTYTVNGTSYTTVVPGSDNQFRWRVRAYDGATAGNWSVYRYFKFNTKTTPTYDRPLIISPANNATFSTGNVTIKWQPVTEATSYKITFTRREIGSNGSYDLFTEATVSSAITSKTFELTRGQYSIGVQARYGTSATYSNPLYITVNTNPDNQYSLTPPVITIPSANQTVDWDYTNFQWLPVEDADNYYVDLEYLSNGIWKTFADYQTDHTYVVGEGIWDNNYRVRIRAKYPNSTYTNWSDWRYFAVDNNSGPVEGVPALIAPADEAQLSTNYVSLDWANVSGATQYEYQVTRFNNSFWVLVSSAIVTDSNAAVTLSSGLYGQYSFRVRALNNGSYGDWSQYNHFYYYGGSNNYGAPVINSPYSNQTYTSHSVDMNWSSVSGAVTYEVNVNYESNSNWYEEGTYSASNLSYTKYFSYDNHYRMRVRAKFGDYSYGTWSEWREFRVGDSGNYNYGAPTIYAPTENQYFSSYSTVNFGWYASSGNVSRYDIAVEYESNGIWYSEGNYSATSASYSKYFSYNNEYRLRVRAVFSDGSVGNWSDWRNFAVGTSNSNSNNNNSYGAPVISSPTANQYFSSNSYVTIGWNSFYSVLRYETVVEYQSGSSWMVFSNYSTTNNTYQAYFNQSYNYRVKVRVVFNDNSATNWSDYRYFSVGTTPVNNYSIPVVISPTANQTLYSRYVTPSWNAVSGAVSYELNVNYKSGNGWLEEGLHTASATSFGLTLPNTNDYRLRVRARFSDGSYSIWTGWTEFRVQL